jgi:Domain of unknown function (DUF5047)
VRPVSAQFLAAVTGSHRVAHRARVLAPGYNGTNPGPANPDGSPQNTLSIESGTVTFDRTAQVRGSLDITVSAAWPSSSTDMLTPYGNEIFVERGVVYGGGSTEWVSQGYYRINDIEQQSAPFGSVHITGTDRMQGLIDAQITAPIQFTAGTTILTVIESAVWAVYPWTVFDYDASLATATLATDQITTQDRFTFLDDLIRSYGMVWYWDHRGYLYIHPAPNPAVPVLTVNAGRGGVLATLSRTLTRTGVTNGVLVTGEQANSAPPVSALVVDLNSNSPTFWYGSFGQVPQFFSASTLQTVSQCQAAGLAILQQSTGLPYEVDFSMVPNPALDPLDCVQLQYPGRVENHVLDSIVVPLDVSTAMTGTTRQQVTGVFG